MCLIFLLWGKFMEANVRFVRGMAFDSNKWCDLLSLYEIFFKRTGSYCPAGQPDRAAAHVSEQTARSSLQQRAARAGEAAEFGEAQGGTGELAQAASSASRGAAALGEREGAAEDTDRDSGGSAATEGGGVPKVGREARGGESRSGEAEGKLSAGPGAAERIHQNGGQGEGASPPGERSAQAAGGEDKEVDPKPRTPQL